MTERRPTRNRPVTTTDTGDALTAEEERALRARHGWRIPDDLPLPKKGAGHATLEKKLRELELRAFEASGRIDELRASVADDESAEATKKKIISRLKD